MCDRAAKELPKSERPSLSSKIEDLLEENPIEDIVDLEGETLELEKWVCRHGQLYIEFDTQLRK